MTGTFGYELEQQIVTYKFKHEAWDSLILYLSISQFCLKTSKISKFTAADDSLFGTDDRIPFGSNEN